MVRKEDAKLAGYSDKEIQDYIDKRNLEEVEKNRINPPYKINWVTDETSDNWKNTLVWTIMAFAISNILLDTIRNTVMYLLTGEWWSYWWLKRNG